MPQTKTGTPNGVTIATAIPYVNSTPHIGNALTTLCGDASARYHRLRGENVWFTAGTDENGLKIKEAAEAAGQPTEGFVAGIADRFVEIWRDLHIEYDAFTRTSGPEHARATQAFVQRLVDDGHIYTATYEGWYDVSTETYFRENELVDGKSPDGNEVRKVSEENYFFRLSSFAEPLLKHLEANPGFIVPETRANEVLSFIRQGLRDMAVSRRNVGWGVPWPGDPSQVVYVWFDAVINYVTACGWPDGDWESKWPAAEQWVGKDILTRFHATLWPAMLLGAGLGLPERVIAHAWVLFGANGTQADKMSKSRGNVVYPLPLAQELAGRSGCAPEIAVDAVRWYLLSTMGYESDTVFTPDEFDRRYNGDLANDLGNALNRSLAMAHKFSAGVVPEGEIEGEAKAAIVAFSNAYADAMARCRLDKAAASAMELVRFLNKYVDERAPWALARTNDPALPRVILSMLSVLRAAEGLVRPFMPRVADEIAVQLGQAPLTRWDEIGTLPSGGTLQTPRPIFPRLDLAKLPPMEKAPKHEKPPKEKKPVKEEPPAEEITIDDFMRVRLRVARIIEAEPLEGSDKLLKLQVRLGDEARQIVAGLRASYAPEDLIGRQVVVVANLKPATLRNAESQGMLLAATDDEGNAILLEPDREAPEGARVR